MENTYSVYTLEKQLEDSWTAKRMANAMPVPLPKISNKEIEDYLKLDVERKLPHDFEEEVDNFIIVPPKYSNDKHKTLATPVSKEERRTSPYKSVGKLFFKRGGKDFFVLHFFLGIFKYS